MISETMLEQLYSKQRRKELIQDELMKDFSLEEYSSDEIKALCASTQWKNIPLVSAAASLCGGEPEDIAYWAELLLNMDTDLFEIYFHRQYMISTLIELDCQEEIDNTMYLPPMVSKPNKLVKNSDSARYWHKEDLILGHRYNYHDGDISLDVLNRQNQIKLHLDWDFINEYEFDSTDELFCKQREKVWNLLEDNTFYLTNSVDKRGRLYCNGYHVNIQGSPEQRACINLKEE